MSKKQVLILIGAWVALFLFLGFPSQLDTILALITGICIIGIALRLPIQDKAPITTRAPYTDHKNTSRQTPVQPERQQIQHKDQPNEKLVMNDIISPIDTVAS